MPDCNLSISIIEPTEYIGNSLVKINDNFTNLRLFLCNDEGTGLYTKMDVLELSANNLTSSVNNIFNTVETGSSRAWVRFKGDKDTTNTASDLLTDRFIRAEFNVRSVYRRAIGRYRIYFKNILPNTNYAIVGTSSETGANSWVSSQTLGVDFADIKIANDTDPEFVSVIIF